MTKRVILTIITILWMIIIFTFSSEKANKSTENSRFFVTNTIVKIYKIFDSNASDEKVDSIVDTLDVPVRKIAHFAEYFILGLLIFFTLRAYNIKNIYLMILICFIYACFDELHQLFVAGRDGNIIDVMIDTLGSTSAIIIFNRKKER